ncbi:hypothetical protein SAMN04487996_103197 [Dyadobacter soli]|uniref:Uncharacterized protein n=1 Tax=Dyadobacter soli TaxID=659014 RepID=A0A1G6ZQG3_9BACT|nr:hypothetical protein [Dyadobacter soli]SDE04761.1 hypothetical protein SAMN04487996_103197 [Dyadobacter soli]
MNKDIYPFYQAEDDFLYFFVSSGIKGDIQKAVVISDVPDSSNYPSDSVYNLGFGDVVAVSSSWILDDSPRSGNGDMPKVIATVALIAMDFLREHPWALLSLEGYVDEKSALQGKNHRNILYQRAIDSNWAELSTEFRFWGVKSGKTEDYIVGNQYDRILVNFK